MKCCVFSNTGGKRAIYSRPLPVDDEFIFPRTLSLLGVTFFCRGGGHSDVGAEGLGSPLLKLGRKNIGLDAPVT